MHWKPVCGRGPGGAGNGLGTLYALQKAALLARQAHGVDLEARLRAGGAQVTGTDLELDVADGSEGLLKRTQRGREATPSAYDYFGVPKEPGEQAKLL